MADVKWIKLATNLFDNRKIKQIRKMPEGKSIVLIWIYILCLAGTLNDNGLIYFAKDIPYTDEMLATEFDEDIKIIRLALQVFQQFKMVEIVDSFLLISNWEKYQSVESLAKIRENARLRKAKQRERQKQELLTDSMSRDSHVTSRQCHATEKEKEEEKELELDKDIKDIVGQKKTPDYAGVINYFNLACGTSYRSGTAKTQTFIRARYNEGFTLEDFKTVIDKKSKEWLGTNMAQYLRPETLFSNKFEGYLNQKNGKAPRQETVPEWMEQHQKERPETAEEEIDLEEVAELLRSFKGG